MPLFSVEERVKMLKEVTKDLPNVEIIPFDGLLVDFAEQIGADVVIRGLRAITDFEYELQMSQTNQRMKPDIETMFLTTSIEYSYLSSTTVREIAAFWGRRITVCAGSRRDRTQRKDESKKRRV